MKLSEIRDIPTTIDGVHDSVFRSYHIIDKVLELLEAETPHKVIIEIIRDLETEINVK